MGMKRSATPASSPRIHLHVDRVVLRGIAREQRDVLMRGLHTELSRLLAAPDFAHGLQSRHCASVRGGELRTTHDSGPGELGTQAAQRVLQSLRGS